MKYHLELTKHDRDMGTTVSTYTYDTRAERDAKIASVYGPDQEVDCDTGLFYYSHNTWEVEDENTTEEEAQLIEAMTLAKGLGAEDVIGYAVCTITPGEVNVAMKMEGAHVFGLWAHLTDVLLCQAGEDKLAAMIAMTSRLNTKARALSREYQRAPGSTH